MARRRMSFEAKRSGILRLLLYTDDNSSSPTTRSTMQCAKTCDSLQAQQGHVQLICCVVKVSSLGISHDALTTSVSNLTRFPGRIALLQTRDKQEGGGVLFVWLISSANSNGIEEELRAFTTSDKISELLRLCPPHLWYHGSNNASCPRPILITNKHQDQLLQLHTALIAAIVDIVERWWTDTDAGFPGRMPLEKQEEDLLLWLEGQRSDNDPPYKERLGSWRPDFLVEDDETGSENYRLTEINARFCFNGFMHQAYGQEALSTLGVGNNGTVHATDSALILKGLLDLFDNKVPLHLLKGEEPGIDIHMFIDFMNRYVGIRPRLISPADLRLIPDPENRGGYKLCCVMKESKLNGYASSPFVLQSGEQEPLEEIHQIGLELHQHELFALPMELLHQISLRCFNDMRTVLLVHDKRMLGIIKQEIPTLVARYVLTDAQGHALDEGIADTILPGSTDLEALIQLSKGAPKRRKQFLLKPVRGGKGAGIVFDDELTPAQWVASLERLRKAELVSGSPSYVVQRRVWPCLYDLILAASGERVKYPLIGTYHTVNGHLLGIGTWRSSPDRICAVSHGGAWICSVVREE
ncbi:hypothetical protein AJ79_02447 [Helicocarpus griseus UAMH5409]|uniref:Glutathionylspermidine synthase pre-ATP-grasp-like domain-containing protein n=1 Tax=Helicocarpus griseus UAMH5409 TaxID=1447875 RepID=A0A2B7Y2H6_9EURO|nr:hypothetical protein AJ79_02447 [Helicocarpus griseus UAMH5409]